MINKDKVEKFNAIARDLYVKEYLGTDEYGKDKEYEDELTDLFSKYLQNVFYNTGYEIKELQPVTHQSNIIKILRVT